jgi:propanol-preferring alcohol dehydrogenase
VVITGIGGLGHVAIQYAKAMGLHVAAVDLGPEKMALARELGAEIRIDAKTQDPPKEIQKQIGGAHGVLVTAVSMTCSAASSRDRLMGGLYSALRNRRSVR